MTNEQILKKAIEKAEKNGWNKDEFDCDFAEYHSCPEIIIYRHDFAKAIWGKEKKFAVSSYGCTDENDEENEPSYDGKKEYDDSLIHKIPAWQYHLQQMVLLPNNKKFKYIEKLL